MHAEGSAEAAEIGHPSSGLNQLAEELPILPLIAVEARLLSRGGIRIILEAQFTDHDVTAFASGRIGIVLLRVLLRVLLVEDLVEPILREPCLRASPDQLDASSKLLLNASEDTLLVNLAPKGRGRHDNVLGTQNVHNKATEAISLPVAKTVGVCLRRGDLQGEPSPLRKPDTLRDHRLHCILLLVEAPQILKELLVGMTQQAHSEHAVGIEGADA
mmetsp:Transcript_6167/g.24024  ORF Transcript_6167/g.24024 Transcript_6167/m.24024 type:complete len:216 (-) Transcript_6167:143-790(-)